MKYFVLLVILSVGALAQNQIHLTPNVVVDEKQLVVINKAQSTESNPNFINSAETVSIENIEPQTPPIPPGGWTQQQKAPHHRRPQRRDHENRPYPDHNQVRQNQPFYDDQLRTDDSSHCSSQKHHRKSWNKKPVGHIVFWIILAVVSIFLIKKCVSKRNTQQRRRLNAVQQITNPVMIDEQINKHYSEIIRLQQLKSSIEAQNRAQQPQPIIYHEQYPQHVYLNHSSGRMVNENCYPRNFAQNVEMQNIPVGVPVMIRNSYNHPEIYRQN